jgi:hypothetical protein
MGVPYRPAAEPITPPREPIITIFPPTRPPATPEGIRLATQNIVGRVGRSLHHKEFAPGRAPALTPAEQIAVCKPPDDLAKMNPALAASILAGRAALIARVAQQKGRVA